jgi:glycosyltransferase involved in cell wall biosynthesis
MISNKLFIVLNNSPKYGGGVEQVVNNLISNFSESFKKNITLVCNDEKEGKEFMFKGIKCFNLKTKKHTILDKVFMFSQTVYSFKIYKFLKKEIEDGSLINIHGIEYTFFLSLFRKRIKKRFVLLPTFHGSVFQEYTEYVVEGLPLKYLPVKFFFFFFRWYFFIYEKITLAGLDKIIVISKQVKEYFLKQYGLDKDKIEVIFNGIDIKDKFKKEFKKDTQFKALIIGSTVLRKGLDYAIRIIQKMNSLGFDITLTVVGFNDYPKYFKPNEKFVNYVGRVLPSEVDNYYKQNDFLIFPSRHEGFPLTVLSALQFGLPCLVSTASRCQDIGNFEEFGFILDDFDDNKWIKALQSLTNLDYFNKLVRNITNNDFSLFDWKILSLKYEKLFIYNLIKNEN